VRIEVQYSVSQGPHLIEITQAEIDQMRRSAELTATQRTRTGIKTITITGTPQEIASMAAALLNDAVSNWGTGR
jgi:hypothetical protein